LGLEVKRHLALIVIAANVLAMVGLAFIYPHLMLSPGPPTAGHAELTENCFACHSPWRGADSQRCRSCHAPADIGLRTTMGTPISPTGIKAAFHQELISQDCMACHSEHEGTRLTERGRRPFTHALLREAIRGQCATCHQQPRDNLHQQVTGDCAQCHGLQAWRPASFDHARFFALDRDHDAECVTCHVNNVFKGYTCYGCHEHQPARVRAEHVEEGIRDFEDCVRCHRSASGEPGERGSREGRDRD
jgi:hypothetical protein